MLAVNCMICDVMVSVWWMCTVNKYETSADNWNTGRLSRTVWPRNVFLEFISIFCSFRRRIVPISSSSSSELPSVVLCLGGGGICTISSGDECKSWSSLFCVHSVKRSNSQNRQTQEIRGYIRYVWFGFEYSKITTKQQVTCKSTWPGARPRTLVVVCTQSTVVTQSAIGLLQVRIQGHSGPL